jgi:aspartate dehydrogenase
MPDPLNVLLIGHGAIAQEVLKRLDPDEPARVAAILVREHRLAETRAALPEAIEVVSSLDDLRALPDLAAECAGHAGVVDHGAAVLRRGIDLIVISIGALADKALYGELAAAAADGGAKLLLPAGAVAGADALAAARVGGLDRVVYASRKPPRAWKGTPGEDVADLDNLESETVLFEGAADEAAKLYPQNANVAATIALAGAGFDATSVRLIADPQAPGNIHQVHAEGTFGAFDIEVRGKTLPDNPKTSALAAYSVVAAIRRRAAAIEV